MVKKSSASYRRAKQVQKNVLHIMPNDLAAELAALEAMPDSEIDYSDIPEQIDWSDAVRGRLYRPIKQQISIRIDLDVLRWFKAQGHEGYATRIGKALREYVQAKQAMQMRMISQKKRKS